MPAKLPRLLRRDAIGVLAAPSDGLRGRFSFFRFGRLPVFRQLGRLFVALAIGRPGLPGRVVFGSGFPFCFSLRFFVSAFFLSSLSPALFE
jgi:hypothetical protein